MPPKNIPTTALIIMTVTVSLVISALVGQVTFLSSSTACFTKVVGAIAITILNPPTLADMSSILPNSKLYVKSGIANSLRTTDYGRAGC